MTRLERSKMKIERIIKVHNDQEEITLAFQELVNNLPTYNEQREFCKFYIEITEKVLEKAW